MTPLTPPRSERASRGGCNQRPIIAVTSSPVIAVAIRTSDPRPPVLVCLFHREDEERDETEEEMSAIEEQFQSESRSLLFKLLTMEEAAPAGSLVGGRNLYLSPKCKNTDSLFNEKRAAGNQTR